jgi:YVTN family beta-propeller protein
VGLFLVISPYILVYHDPGAISIGASLNATTVLTNQTIVVTVTDTNDLHFNNNVALESDWRVQNLSMAPCNQGPSGLEIFGIAVFQGRYTLDNVSSATSLSLYPPGAFYCPVNIALSNAKSFEFGPRQTVKDSAEFKGYWTAGYTPLPGGGELAGVFHSFQPGVYTVVAGDEWGHITFLYFRVTGIPSVLVNQGSVALAYDSAREEVFVTNGSNVVSVISDISDRVVANVTMVKSPQGLQYDDSQSIVYDPAKGEVLVANPANGTVTVMSDVSDSVVATVNVGGGPWGLAYDSARGEVFVTNMDNTLSIISDKNNSVVAEIDVGRGQQGMAYDSSKGEMFVATGGTSLLSNGTVYVISDTTDKIVANVTVGPGPVALTYDSARGEIFVANGESDTVSIISDETNRVTATVTVGGFVWGLAYDSARGEVYVSNSGSTVSRVSVISDAANKVIAHVNLEEGYGNACGVAYDSSKSEIFVGGSTGIVYIIPDSV